MRAKKAKALRRLAAFMCYQQKRPSDTQMEYKNMKKIYKANKGEL